MINTLIPATAHAVFIVTALFAVATPAFSQAPTDAQRSAIRSECRSDYEAHCASVPPGGAASLQCLQKNMSSLRRHARRRARRRGPAASKARPPAPAAEQRPTGNETAAKACRPTVAPKRRKAQLPKPSDAQVTDTQRAV
jgi:hypothetical protein